MRRGVLLIQAAGSMIDLEPVLASGGWRPIRCAEPDRIEAAASDRDCLVSIVVIERLGDFDLRALRAAICRAATQMVAVTSSAALADASIAALLAGDCFDFHTLPVEKDRFLASLGHACGKAALRRRMVAAAGAVAGRHGMVGTSRAMLELYRSLDKVARVDAPVLIGGESGTGKEIAAQAIHRATPGRNGPFVAVNCGAIPPQLMQAQLFGHEKGAFTGAHQRQIGSLEAAGGGTIFLDEIGDLPLESQASLLRFLQESTVVRIGSTRALRVDARVVAATHVDLGAAVADGRFREDLYYRLNVLQLRVPPLRERVEDIPMLVEHVFELWPDHRTPTLIGISRDALRAMREYSWPGNVRELINRVHRAMVMCEGSLIDAEDLGLGALAANVGSRSLATARRGTERDLVIAALVRNANNMAAAARELGVSRVTLYRMAERLAVRPRRREFGAHSGEGNDGNRQ
ncbi:sigma-54 interaction domain-containing protein [Zeimonas arvi]|nr:sigma-54 dependent transcriptional regulator [Zeimonas arvi]